MFQPWKSVWELHWQGLTALVICSLIVSPSIPLLLLLMKRPLANEGCRQADVHLPLSFLLSLFSRA